MFVVTQKGNNFFVEDTAKGKVMERFDSKEMAKSYAKELADKQKDFFSGLRSNITINSDEMMTK